MGLFKPAWMDERLAYQSAISKMKRAVDKVQSQAALADIVLKAPHYNAYMYALGKITDQTVLAELLRNLASQTKKFRAHEQIVKALTDQQALLEAAQNCPVDYVRIIAADRLEDRALAQSVYYDVANTSSLDNERVDAYKKLEDLALRQSLEENVAFQEAKTRWEQELQRARDRNRRDSEEWARAQKRRKEGRCPHCGVYLRGHPDYAMLKDNPSYRFTCGNCGRVV